MHELRGCVKRNVWDVQMAAGQSVLSMNRSRIRPDACGLYYKSPIPFGNGLLLIYNVRFG